MFDIGWAELLVISAVAVLVIGPNDIPKMMHTLGRVMRRVQYVKFALSQQFEDMMKDHDLDELRNLNDKHSKDLPETDEASFDQEHKNEDDGVRYD